MIWRGSQIPGPDVATLAFAGSRIFHAHSHLRVLVLTISVVQNILPLNLLWLTPSHSSALCSRVILEGPAISHLFGCFKFFLSIFIWHHTVNLFIDFCCCYCLLPTLECKCHGGRSLSYSLLYFQYLEQCLTCGMHSVNKWFWRQ